MTSKKNTRRALVSSVIALLLCCSMLVGTTFAWFTDSVTSVNNVITAGNLDIELDYALPYTVSSDEDGNEVKTWITDASQLEWNTVSTDTELFDNDALWEPGFTQVVYLRVTNAGTLALKYTMNVNIIEEILGTSVLGNEIKLSDILMVDMEQSPLKEDGKEEKTPILYASREEANTDEWGTLIGRPLHKPLAQKEGDELSLLPGESNFVKMAIYMPTTTGNEANYRGEDIPQIKLGLNVFATQYTWEEDSFDDQYDKDAAYPALDTYVTASNIDSIDFTEENKRFVLIGEFGDIEIAQLGEGSALTFDNVTATSVTLNGKNTITGENTLSCSLSTNGTAEVPAELIIANATLDMGMNPLSSNQTVDKETAGVAKLVIENSTVKCGNIFVGGHSMNQPIVTAELVIKNSCVSCEENGMGSTISVWGQNAVKAEILDSEIHTYSRGWHQSEDANDNSITFQGGGTIDVNIERSNMHLYGARSIINARQYGNAETTVNFTIDESLIWVVTKSTHGEDTLPVWGAAEITDSMLLFTKNVHQSTPAVFKSFVYGNPVIHGNYAVTTQCQWDADIALADGQTVTFAAGANVSIYDGAGKVRFVCSDPAQVVVEEGATLTNIGVN